MILNQIKSLFTPESKGDGTGETNVRMDLHSGLPFWLIRNGLGPAYPPLNADVRTDVVIVGGGITGALCAYHLAEAGVAVVVVDARTIGTGSTCASTALLQYEIDTPLYELQELVGLDHAVRSYRACARAIATLGEIAQKIDIPDFACHPSVQYASKPAHVKNLRTEAALRNQHGLAVDFLEGSEVGRVLPFPAPAALRSPLAAQMDAWRFTHALHAESLRRGTAIHERTEVIDFRDHADAVELRTASGHRINARHLIYATGYESRDLLPKDVIHLDSTYALVSEAGCSDNPWPDNALIWETAQPYLYMRTAPEGRIIVGGRDERFRSPRLRDALLARKAAALEADIAGLFPNLDVRREFAWCGTFGSTKDGLPYIDRSPTDMHSWFALGMGGNGITFSVIAAEILRDRILGRPNMDAELFRFDR